MTTCFKAVYIVCSYMDLRSGMDRLAALVESQTGNRPYVPDTIIFSMAGGQTVSKGLYGKETDGSCYIRGYPKAVSSGREVSRKYVHTLLT